MTHQDTPDWPPQPPPLKVTDFTTREQWLWFQHFMEMLNYMLSESTRPGSDKRDWRSWFMGMREYFQRCIDWMGEPKDPTAYTVDGQKRGDV